MHLLNRAFRYIVALTFMLQPAVAVLVHVPIHVQHLAHEWVALPKAGVKPQAKP